MMRPVSHFRSETIACISYSRNLSRIAVAWQHAAHACPTSVPDRKAEITT